MKTKNSKIVLSVVLAIVLVAGIIALICYRTAHHGHFPKDMTINGCNVEGMTREEAQEALTDYWNDREISISLEGEQVDTLTDFNLEYDIEEDIRKIMISYGGFGFIHRLLEGDLSLEIEMPAKMSEGFRDEVEDLSIANAEYKVKTKDAYVDKSNRDFEIIKEVYGDNADVEKLEKKLLACVKKGKWDFDYVPEDYYTQPEVVSTDECLKEEQDYCKKYLSYTITYEFGGEDLTLTPAQIDEMAKYGDKTKIDEDEVEDFVEDLAAKYNTVGTYRTYKSAGKGTITVGGVGAYGYKVDQSAEIKQLTADLKAGKDVSREPEYSQTGNARKGVNDLCGLRVEVSTSQQHLWCYSGSTCLLQCDVVTGKLKSKIDHHTPTGVYYIYSKETKRHLRGLEDDGETEYDSLVQYWMPFNGDIGLHDAYWVDDDDFGGTYYIRHGSHGCVNMPLASVRKLFSIVSVGTPVIVY